MAGLITSLARGLRRAEEEVAHDLRSVRARLRARGGHPRTTPPPTRVVTPAWDDEADAWDTVTINGRAWPGLATLSGKGSGQRLDTRKRAGADGARIVSKGYEPSEFTITFIGWTDEHQDALEQLVAELHPRTHPALRNAVNLYHPALALLLINQAVVKTVGIVQPGSVVGTKELQVEFVEYAPPSRATTRAAGPPADIASALGAIDPRFDTSQARDDPNAAASPDQTNTGP